MNSNPRFVSQCLSPGRVVCALVLAAVLIVPARGMAEESPVGDWDLEFDLGNRHLTAVLSITDTDAGDLAGSWRGERGPGEVTELTYDQGALSFLLTIDLRDRPQQFAFAGTIKGDGLVGTLEGPGGKRPVSGVHRKAGTPGPGTDRGDGNESGSGSAIDPTLRDFSYGPHRRNVVDFWQAKSDSPTPLVLYIHGGGFRSGSKDGINKLTLRTLLDAGISVASVEYRLTSDSPLPAAHLDALRALQVMRTHAEEWNFDKKKVGAFGGSAGAQICMWLAFHDDMAKPDSSDPVERESSRLFCVATSGGQITLDFDWWFKNIPGYDESHRDLVELFGQEDKARWQAVIQECSAINHLSADDPPIHMSYSSRPGDPVPADPQKARGWKVHHVNFGIELEKQMDALGIEADLQYPGAKATYRSDGHFFKVKFGKE